jgi:myo-inositol 2-dehydrogenase/D-chiro-inositol 1-dehydrogenase/scyllo-inositol 2-dehydrogenase (NAD+)
MVHAQSIKGSIPDAAVVAIVDPVADAAQGISDFLGGAPRFARLEHALEVEPFDAVVITTPTTTHRPLVETAAKAGKHVFCEKPMSLTTDDCDAMISVADENRVALQLGFMRRFQPEFVAAKERIEAGQIGDPMLIKSLTRGPGLPPSWARSLKLSNGMLAEVNSHDFDTVRWLMNSEIVRVYAEAVNFKRASHGIDDPDFYDCAVVSLRFASDGVGTIDGACPAEYGYDSRVEVLGTRGVLTIGAMQGQPLLMANNRDIGVVTPIFRTWSERFHAGYIAEMAHFIESIESGTRPAVGGYEGRQAVEAVVAANRSWQDQRPVDLLRTSRD